MSCCTLIWLMPPCDNRTFGERLRDDMIRAERITGIPYDKFMNWADQVDHDCLIMSLGVQAFSTAREDAPYGRKFDVVFRLNKYRCVLMNTLDHNYAAIARYDHELKASIDQAYEERDKEAHRNQLRAVGIEPEW